MKKKILGIFAFFLIIGSNFAADLEATTIETTPGYSTGEIDLDVNVGVSPFVFSWTGPDGFVSTDEDLTGLAVGIYTVTVTDQYCGIAILDVEIIDGEIDDVGVSEEPTFELSIYPNPTSGILYLKSSQEINIIVYNVIGEQIMAKNNAKEINLSNQPSGIYMIQISSKNGIVTRKITLL